MGNCKDCGHWEHYADHSGREWNECHIEWVDKTDPIGETDAAIYVTACANSGVLIGLKTGPIFGCAKFQLRSRTKEDT